MIDSGTLGTIAYIQTIIPHVTEFYNDRKHSDKNPLDPIPICSLHNFPILIENYWRGKELFNCFFNENIIELINLSKDHDNYYEKLKKKIQLPNYKNLII